MDKSKFSLVDIIGYIIPGALALVVMLLFYHYPNEDYSSLVNFLKIVKQYSYLMINKSATMGFILPSAFLILSYITGHLFAYVSSITIERFAIWVYGYPSEFLFNQSSWPHIFKDVRRVRVMRPRRWKAKYFSYLMVRIIIILVLLPLSLVVFLIKLCAIDGFLVKGLDPFLKDIIEKKLSSLRVALHIPSNSEYGDADMHRIVHEYYYNKCDCIRHTMDNYVGIYDLMRSLTLIMVIASWLVIFKNLKSFMWLAPINVRAVFLICIFLALTLLFFMAFMKFYRRYTLESYICLASDNNL